MNWNHIFTIAKKDIREAAGNRAVWVPMVIVPLVFIVILPLGLIFATTFDPNASASLLTDPDMAGFLERMPAFLTREIEGMDVVQSGLVLALGYLFAPFFLIIPLMFSTVIAAESFAGERERKTIEALLYTPASDTELFLGKVVAAGLPAVLITWLCFLAYILVVNTASYSIVGRIWFPLATWYPLIFWVAPAISLLGIAATVLISARNPTFMGAYQSSASLVLLVVGLLVGQATGLLYLTVGVSLAVGSVIWLIDVVLMVIAVRTFNRAKLLASAN
jgi:ABC-2 type transport system permease protein